MSYEVGSGEPITAEDYREMSKMEMEKIRGKKVIPSKVFTEVTKVSVTKTTKICPSCKIEKTPDDFGTSNSQSDGLQSWCNGCRKAHYHASKESIRSYYREKKYGLVDEAYQTLLEEQNNTCYICDTLHSKKTPLQVDHCHESGDVRGLLCGSCNRALGLMRDRVDYLLKAIKYLEKFNDR